MLAHIATLWIDMIVNFQGLGESKSKEMLFYRSVKKQLKKGNLFAHAAPVS